MVEPRGELAESPLCLVTGVTGYIGGRLVPELLAAGYRVRVFARSPRRLRDAPWRRLVEVAEGDATDASAVAAALRGVDVAYYLIHALGTGPNFDETDRRTATIFAAAAKAESVRRIVYLGGLQPADEALSAHLKSRGEVGEILGHSGVPTTVLRAAVIIGSGSASFEMLRYLTERLPVMVTPKWVRSLIQPIAVRDVLRYLVGSARMPAEVSRAFDIGGPDVLTYEQMMQAYARVEGLRRRVILPTPFLSPSLSSHWVGVVTPVPGGIARPLVESLRNTVVCREHDIAAFVPDPPEGLVGFESALRLALARVREMSVPTRWSSASVRDVPSGPLPSDPDWAGGSLYRDQRERMVAASPEALWRVLEGIGGERGWYSLPLAWRVRGLLDRASGGPGLRRGRRHPDDLLIGDALDWWRVEEIEEGRLIRLRAEMRLPGLAWLELEVGSEAADGPAANAGGDPAANAGGDPAAKAHTVFRQRALFHPHGLAGHAYWWSVWPFHGIVFGEMQRNIARAAERLDREVDVPATASADDLRRVAS